MSDFEPSDYLNLNKPLRKYDDVFAAERVSSPSNHQFCIYSQLHIIRDVTATHISEQTIQTFFSIL